MDKRVVLRDKRTGKYFGGGRADKLFSFWVISIQEAKLFPNVDAVQKPLQELVDRNKTYGVSAISANPVIGPNIPPYEDESYETIDVLLKQ